MHLSFALAKENAREPAANQLRFLRGIFLQKRRTDPDGVLAEALQGGSSSFMEKNNRKNFPKTEIGPKMCSRRVLIEERDEILVYVTLCHIVKILVVVVEKRRKFYTDVTPVPGLELVIDVAGRV